MSKTHSLTCSNGMFLRFETDEEFAEFEREETELRLKHYSALRAKYGIFASNQNRYVASEQELNGIDSRVMEDLFNSTLAKAKGGAA